MSVNRNRYNRDLDTVGTEMSNDEFTDASTVDNDYARILNALGQNVPNAQKSNPTNRNHNSIFSANKGMQSANQRGGAGSGSDSYDITDSSLDDDTKAKLKARVNQTYNNQSGGFLGGLFGRESKASSKAYINVTELIASACESGNIVAMDFLLQRPFAPDFNYKNDCGDNIYHILARCGAHSLSARNALTFMLQNKMGLDKLNEENDEGNTPLHCAAESGLDDIIELMEESGAERKLSKAYMIVETIRESESESESEFEPKIAGPVVGPSVEPVTLPGELRDLLQMFENVTASTVLPTISEEESEPTPSQDVPDIETLAKEESARQIFKPFRTVPEVERVPILTDAPPGDTKADIAAIVNAFKTGSASPSELTFTENPQISEMVDRALAMTERETAPTVPTPQRSEEETQRFITPDAKLQTLATEDLASYLVNLIKGDPMTGGSRRVNKSKRSDSKTVKGKRVMKTFSDSSDINKSYMVGGATLSEMARATDNKKDELHAAALKKVKENLDSDDEYLAKAVKAIIYKEIREKHPELSGLDRAAETLKAITKTRVKKALEQEEVINQIVSHLKTKDEARKKKLSEKSESKDDDKEKDKAKSKAKTKPEPETEQTSLEFESSEQTGSSNEESDESEEGSDDESEEGSEEGSDDESEEGSDDEPEEEFDDESDEESSDLDTSD